MKSNNPNNQIAEIKAFMEKSTLFISLSGLSGIVVGIFALLGILVAYIYLNSGELYFLSNIHAIKVIKGINIQIFFFWDAILVLILAVGSAFYFTSRKANKDGQKIWNFVSKRFAVNLFIPLFVGGVFCIALIMYSLTYLIAPVMLIFYGVALLNASKFTFDEIRYLGLVEILLGLIVLFMPQFSLLFWAFGFGVLHIFYGSIMYKKYER